MSALATTVFFSSASNMSNNTARTHCNPHIGVVISLVEAEILRASGSAWTPYTDLVEHLSNHPLVVAIGSRDLNGQRYASTIGQDMSFYPQFPPVSRVSSS